jgi:uncharacterized protein YukE
VLQAVERKTVSDFVSVDVAHLRRLSEEFRNSASELRSRIELFRQQTENTQGAYGETPNAAAAEREYQQTTQHTVEQLEEMHRNLVETADALAEQARVSSDAATAAELDAVTLNNAL